MRNREKQRDRCLTAQWAPSLQVGCTLRVLIWVGTWKVDMKSQRNPLSPVALKWLRNQANWSVAEVGAEWD